MLNSTDVKPKETYILLRYTMPFIFFIGVPGSLICMVIWCRKIKHSTMSTNLLQTAISATDTYVLIHGCLRNWMNAELDIDLRKKLKCQAPLVLFTFATDLSSWLIILLCLERGICTFYPIKSREICRIRNGFISLCVVVLFLAAVNSTLLFIVNSTDCGYTYPDKEYLYSTWQWIDLCKYSIVPFVVIVFVNVSILLRIRTSHKGVKSKTSSLQKNKFPSRSSGHDITSKILKTVFCMSISHFLFTVPIGAYFINLKFKNTTIKEIVIILQLFNHFSHFYIYSLTSSVFVKDLHEIFPFLKRLSKIEYRDNIDDEHNHMPRNMMGNKRKTLCISSCCSTNESTEQEPVLVVDRSLHIQKTTDHRNTVASVSSSNKDCVHETTAESCEQPATAIHPDTVHVNSRKHDNLELCQTKGDRWPIIAEEIDEYLGEHKMSSSNVLSC